MTDDQLLNEDEATPTTRRAHGPLLLTALAALLGLALCVTTALLLLRGEVRSLRPFRSEPTAIALVISGQPQLVTFPELSENAAAYLNQRIRVTGYYLPLSPPECDFFNGPVFQWSLVSEGLQLNAQGFERPLALAGPGTTLMVEGIWRLRSGPYGCGKAPETMDVWYLQVERIVQPNPLVATTADPAAFLLSGISTPLFPTIGPSNTPRPTGQATATLLPGATDTALPAGTGTAVTGTGTPTLTATTTGTASVTPTGLFTTTPEGTRPSTPTITPTGTLTTPGATSPPPPATATPPGNPYPGATNTPPLPGGTPSPTPGY
ncbi:MAG TPA: hypothetical protein PLD25_22565 [Chloroflexota bacterium]|nr:hypothetical protein [Chloroflexota bacterium]